MLNYEWQTHVHLFGLDKNFSNSYNLLYSSISSTLLKCFIYVFGIVCPPPSPHARLKNTQERVENRRQFFRSVGQALRHWVTCYMVSRFKKKKKTH